ncbi:hypothetical protein EGH21_07335 [Halomicroarcula sp. F13]|uniref:Halobacterial output domain-containing protein n=1 Tax=Haloarcula rubra TaxID=2487747 RepID=A0AAW4PR85_9EURY|nr:HalOD1 output domain-containing protein [Halomicroarcula rubra]MBX0322842.1 hypothetical protein [Halomicroarcula rubra]
MKSDDGTVYMIRGGAAGEGSDEWVSPEPAADVIVDAVVAATDLDRDDVDAIESYVDAADLRAVVGDGDRERISFEVAGHEVTVTADGDVTVA